MISKARLFINTSLLLAVLLMITSHLSAQPDNSRQIDSLKVLFPKQEGVEKIESLYELSFLVSDTNLDSAIYYDSLALEIASHKNLVNWKVKILSDLSHLSMKKFNYKIAKILLDEALLLSEKQNCEAELPIVYTDFGNYFLSHNLYDSALYYFYQSLKVANLKTQSRATALNNIGLIYLKIHDYQKALYFQKQALKINVMHENLEKAIINYINIGITHLNLKEYDESIKNFEKAIGIKKKGDLSSWSHAYKGLGQAYLELNEFQKSRESFYRAIEIGNKYGDLLVIASCYSSLTELYIQEGKYNLAMKALLKSTIITNKTGSLLANRYNCFLYSQLYEALGQTDSAYYYHKKYLALQDSIFTPKLTHNLTNLQLAYQAEESQQVIEEKEQRLSQTTKYLWLAGMVLLICVVQLFRFYHRFL